MQVTPVSRFADSSEWCKLFDRWKSKQHKNVSNSRQNFEQIYGSVRQIVLSVNYQLGSPFPEIDLWPTYDGTMVLVSLTLNWLKSSRRVEHEKRQDDALNSQPFGK